MDIRFIKKSTEKISTENLMKIMSDVIMLSNFEVIENFDKYKTLSLDFSGDYTFAISDNGKNFVGSKNHLLPHNLIVPPVINNIEVKSFQIGTFAFNDRIQTLTIPDTVTVIPYLFADMAVNLNTVQGLKNIKTIGKNAFRVTATEVFNVPSIIQGGLGNAIFVYCSRLKFVNLGENISFIPEETFYGCYKLVMYFSNSCSV